MLHSRERRRRSGRSIRCSVQWIALGIICVFSTRDSFVLSGCQAFSSSFAKQVLVRNYYSRTTLRRGTLWNFDKGATTTILSLHEDNKDDNNDDDDEKISTPGSKLGLPALGPAGTSSRNITDIASMDDLLDGTAAATATMEDNKTNGENTNTVQTFVNPKFALQYTCNVCDTTNRVIVSRQAYREGLVIATCKGCQNKHWIADNLDPALTDSNIEEYFENRGLGDTVKRVNKEVYEIERVYGLKEGEITDEAGDTVLE